MKAVILAGGLGTRISEETHIKPKPMVEIGGKPLLWHILKIYSYYGINDFIICLGFKGYLIKEYFANYFLRNSNVIINLDDNKIEILKKNSEKWKITLIDTGIKAQTAGRLKKAAPYLKDEDAFCFSYGDGLSNINIKKLINHHNSRKKILTISAVKPPADRYGFLKLDKDNILNFKEKPERKNLYVNGGFMVMSPKFLKYIDNSKSSLESDTIPKVLKKYKLNAYRHNDFWYAMDTLRDKNFLEELWKKNKAPWKIW